MGSGAAIHTRIQEKRPDIDEFPGLCESADYCVDPAAASVCFADNLRSRVMVPRGKPVDSRTTR
jgi:hypothetical protein